MEGSLKSSKQIGSFVIQIHGQVRTAGAYTPVPGSI